MLVEYATTERFQDARRLVGPAALPETGYTAKVVIPDLPAGQDVFYRVTFLAMRGPKFCSMKITDEIREYAAERGLPEAQVALGHGLREKAEELRKAAASCYRPAEATDTIS